MVRPSQEAEQIQSDFLIEATVHLSRYPGEDQLSGSADYRLVQMTAEHMPGFIRHDDSRIRKFIFHIRRNIPNCDPCRTDK